MKVKCYLGIENGCQWQTIVFSESETGELHWADLPSNISGEFLTNLMSKEHHFQNKIVNGNHYLGWTISVKEYDRLRKIIDLYPKHKEYLKLLE